ncbi:IS5 family transposase [Gemmatimonas sp.]|uniref:IS5 family transposase n=1 Tax=Gemmatimonas sp. TaxID=1962908 RepID=UPI003340934F
MQRYALRDDQWTKIKDFLPGREGHVGGTAPDNRLFVDAVIYRYRTGIPWRDLAERYGDWKATHRRFRRWCESGVFARILGVLALDADAEFMSIDSTSVRAHQHSAGAQKKNGEDQAIGRSRGGLTTKIHAIVDALGNPVALSLTPGQAADITQAAPLLDQVEPDAFLADKGYDSDALVATLEGRGIKPVIPPKANRREPRKTDFALYRERNLVERFFGNLKQYRALATRYDKLANTFLAAVALVCVLFWLN